ncbi:MAG: glycosyltransferase family 39 protein [Spartobacteria bacterium]
MRLAALGILCLTVLTRLPSLLYSHPIDDETVYSIVANEIVDGGRPYIDAVERKPPLLFWTYAAVFEIAGKFNWHALHAVALLWVLGTMAGLYVIGQQLFDSATGLIAALLYSVFASWATWKNLAFNGELLMNLPLVWAWAIAFRRTSSRVRLDLIVAGALLCAGFLLKQPAAIAAVPIGIYFLLPSYRASRGFTIRSSLVHTLMLTTGFFVTLALVAFQLRRQGILADAYYWTIGDHAIRHVFWNRGIVHTLAFIGGCLPLVIGAAMGGRNDHDIWAAKRAERTTLLWLVAASVVGAAAGTRFYPHYYIQLVPPLALLAAPYYARLWAKRTQPNRWLPGPAVSFAWLAATVVTFAFAQSVGLAGRHSLAMARYVTENSTPSDRIFVWGHSAKTYIDAGRRPACRYVLTYPLTGYVFGAPLPGIDTRKWIVPGAWSNLEQDFRSHPPLYVLDVRTGRSRQYPIRNFPILAGILAESYQPVSKTDEGVIYRRFDGELPDGKTNNL